MITKIFSSRFKIKSFKNLLIDNFCEDCFYSEKDMLSYSKNDCIDDFFEIRIVDKIYCIVEYYEDCERVLTKVYPIEQFNDLVIIEEIKKTVKKLYK